MCEFDFIFLFSSVNNDDVAFYNNQFSAECWSFVEKKLKITIPTYIKNVLLYCGYDNIHTISTIGENDLENIVAQVRKGGIVDYFSNKTWNALYNPLQGSNKSEENFEFRLGHRTLLMLIVNILKQNLVNMSPVEEGVEVPTLIKHDESAANFSLNHNQCIPTPSFHEDIINFQATLLKKTIQSLFTHSKEMYDKVCTCCALRYNFFRYLLFQNRFQNMEIIGEKICNDLVYVRFENRKRLYSAEIKCPYCSTNITVKHTSNSWHTRNFENHLASVHISMKYKFNPEIDTEIKGIDRTGLEGSSLPIQEESHSINFVCIGDQLIEKEDKTGQKIVVLSFNSADYSYIVLLLSLNL